MRLLRQISPPHWGTLLTGVLIVAAYPPWDFRFLAWICLIPWLMAVSRAGSWRQAAFQGLWLSILMSILGFHWVAYVLHEFGDVPWLVAFIGLLLYSFVGQPQFLLFAPLFFALSIHEKGERSKSTAILIIGSVGIALLYTGLDWGLPKLFRDTLGHAFYSASWLRQVAELGGAHLLTFGAIWVNLALFLILRTYKEKHRDGGRIPAFANLGAALTLIGAFAAFGIIREQEWKERLSHADSTLQAGIIQANIGDFEKVAAERGMQEAAEKILGDYFSLSNQALALQAKPDFIIWPETAYASTYRKPMTTGDYSRDARIETWVRSNGVPLLFGSYDRDNGRDFNTFFVLSPQSLVPATLDPAHSTGEDLQFYHKNILLMFGEYIPFQEYLPAISHLFPQVANFGRGSGAHLLQIPLFSDRGGPNGKTTQLTAAPSSPLQGSPSRVIPVSPAICYEVLFPDYVIEAANLGSRLIVNVTNDSWFGPYGEPHLHLALSTFRSVETRLPMIRSTNTGFSALVTQDGEIVSRSRLFEPEILNVSIPLIEPPSTLLKRWGDWFGKFALVAGGSILLALWRRERKLSTRRERKLSLQLSKN